MRKWFFVFVLVLSFGLVGCSSENTNDQLVDHDAHAHMAHDQSGELPAGLKNATSPQFAVGSKAKIIAGDDHMPGMNGATATIVGAYDSVAYTVTYDPTDGGAKVNAHKWIIQEEIKDAKIDPFKVGDQVVLNAKHTNGMLGAKGTIDSVQTTVVYMIDFTTTDGKSIKNHQWVIENELVK